MKKRYVLAICLAAALRLQAQTPPNASGFGPQQAIIGNENENRLTGPIEVFTADLDGDGDQDILSASADDGRVVWYENDGSGSFGEQQVIATQADRTESVYAADLDGDGDQDVLAASDDDKIAWYKNNGTGSFGEPQVVAATQIDDPGSVYAADLDGDGDQDILLADNDKTAWYENDGSGSFGEQQVITTQIDDARSVYAADLDGDGDRDVLSASVSDDKIAWYENDGSGSFGGQQVITTQADAPFSVYATDLDGDGDQDVLSASFLDDKIAWYENDGSGSFGEQQVITTQADDARSVYATDLDGDGDQDVLSASASDNKIAWYENDGTGSFGGQQVITTQADDARSVYAADLDGDGDQDVLAASDDDDEIAWYENDSSGSFGEQQVVTATQINNPRSIYAADIDGDGDQDMLLTDNDKTAWYKNDGTGSFGEPQAIRDGRRAFSTTGLDLDGDGDQDMLSAFADDGKVVWYKNDGTGSFGEPQVITTQIDDTRSIYVADLDGDGDQDVVLAFVANTGEDVELDTVRVAWYENDGTGSFGEQQAIATQPSESLDVYAADLDGDGDQDVLLSSSIYYGIDKIVWYENNGSGSFSEEKLITTQLSGVNSVYTADLDGDGDQDVLSNSNFVFDTGEIAWYENDGSGSFGEQQVIQNDGGFGYTTDLDDDGDQDVLSVLFSDDQLVWYENDGTGIFGEGQVIQDGDVRSFYAADLDGDGDQDVLVASDDDKVVWYENLLPQFSSVPSITTLTLFNARTDTPVQPLTDGLVLDLLSPAPNLYDYNVAAEVNAASEQITRVTFELDAPDAANQDTVRTEQKVPYVLFGHLGQDFREVQAYAGDYTLTATLYYQDSTGAEVAGRSQTVSFTFVTPNMDIREPRLIDARSGEVIESLEAGDMISLASDQSVSILADTRFPQFNSVEFFLDGPGPDGQVDVQRLENASPYSLFGDGGQPLAEGEYELRVIAYLGKNRDGYAGPQTVIPFSVVHQASESESLAYPVPFTSELNLQVGAVDLNQTRIQLVHSYGRVYEVMSSEVQATEEGLRINVAHLPTGPYTIHVQQAGGMQTFRGSKQ